MLKKLIFVVAAALAGSGAMAQTAGGTVTGDLPGGCLFASPIFNFAVGTLDFSKLAQVGYIDSPVSISAGCSVGVTGQLTVGTEVLTIDADLSARVRKGGECDSMFFGGASGPVSLVGSGQLESIPLCVRIQKTNPAASSLALGARALSVTDPALFSISVQ